MIDNQSLTAFVGSIFQLNFEVSIALLILIELTTLESKHVKLV